MKKVIGFLLLVVAAYFGYGYFETGEKATVPEFVTEEVNKGLVIETVSATGKVEPITLVKVGSQVSGRIEKIHVDFNSKVKANQIICELDQVPLQARVSQDKASLLISNARLKDAESKLKVAKLELERSEKLDKDDLISKSELDQERASYESLKAQVDLAKAQVAQAEASLQMSKANLNFATIRSPVDGIVISRAVDEGQTVAASFQAPVLFEIAQNLKEVNILASVGEADIGQIKAGQKVTFNVDAYPDDEFTGKVLQVRLAATDEQNVVTYTVVVSARNEEDKLFPGMSASLLFEVGRSAEDDLRVSNAALRFEPQMDWVESKVEDESYRRDSSSKSVWVLTNEGRLKQVIFRAGYSSRMHTQIVGGDVAENLKVVSGIHEEEVEDEGTTNPFSRNRRSSKKKKKKK